MVPRTRAHVGLCALLLLPALSGCIAWPNEESQATAFDALAEAPTWQIGQWWDIDLHHERTGNDVSLRRVVAGHDGDHWFVGMPVDAFVEYALIMHVPALGDLWGPGLGFDAHDRPIEWLRFPLHNETTWTTSFYWAPNERVTATVERTGTHTATVHMDGTRPIIMDYDARVGAAVHVRIEGYVEWWVRDWGYGHEGTVRVPVDQDLVFYHGRSSQDFTGNPNVAPGLELQDIRLGAHDRASFALLLYDARPDADTIGHADIRASVTAPDGTQFTAEKGATTTGDVLIPFGHGPVEGTWYLQATVAGAGSALLEGIAYNILDVPLRSQD